MKNIRKKIITLVCAGLMLFSLAACDSEALTPYQTAVKNGFTGTEKEWLASLKGKDGEDGEGLDIEELYETAKANGYEGTIIDFMKELNVQVQEDNDTTVIAQNITSVVSIYCGFAKTTGGGGFWGGSRPTTEYYSTAGAGVIIDLNKEAGNALIVTNYHVIYDADSNTKGISDSIYLYTYGAYNRFSSEAGDMYGDGMKATFVGGAMDYDIALLKVEGNEFLKTSVATGATIADSDSVRMGEKVFAIGNPDGAGIAVTEGTISLDSEYISMSSTDGVNRSVEYRVMRTDTAINHGNSGGGLFNTKGELIGITNAKNTENEGTGYALPITQVKYLCENIMDNGGLNNKGVVKRAMLGVKVSVTASKGLIDETGNIKLVEEFAVAEAATVGNSSYGKLEVGDVFKSVSVNGGESVTLTRQYQLNDLLLTVRKGDTLVFTVRNSNGEEEQVTVVFDKDAYFATYD